MADHQHVRAALPLGLSYGLKLNASRDFLLTAVLTASVVSFFSTPFFGHLSDRVGRKRMYMLGAALVGIYGFVYFGLLDSAVPACVAPACCGSYRRPVLAPHEGVLRSILAGTLARRRRRSCAPSPSGYVTNDRGAWCSRQPSAGRHERRE
jgi:MFS family permease